MKQKNICKKLVLSMKKRVDFNYTGKKVDKLTIYDCHKNKVYVLQFLSKSKMFENAGRICNKEVSFWSSPK